MWLLKSKFFIQFWLMCFMNKQKKWIDHPLDSQSRINLKLSWPSKLNCQFIIMKVMLHQTQWKKSSPVISHYIYLAATSTESVQSWPLSLNRAIWCHEGRRGRGWWGGGGYRVRVPRHCWLPLSSVGKEFVRVINSWHDSRTSSCGWNQTPSSYHRLKSSSSTSLLWSQLISRKSDMECWPEQGGTRLQSKKKSKMTWRARVDWEIVFLLLFFCNTGSSLTPVHEL